MMIYLICTAFLHEGKKNEGVCGQKWEGRERSFKKGGSGYYLLLWMSVIGMVLVCF